MRNLLIACCVLIGLSLHAQIAEWAYTFGADNGSNYEMTATQLITGFEQPVDLIFVGNVMYVIENNSEGFRFNDTTGKYHDLGLNKLPANKAASSPPVPARTSR